MKNFLMAICLLLLPVIINAHGFWIETSGSGRKSDSMTIKLFFGDYPAGERMTGKALDKIKDINVFVTAPEGGKQQVAMAQTNEYWIGHYITQEKGAYLITGVNDNREVQDWTKHNLGITRPVQYLKVWYIVGGSKKKDNSQPALDIVVDKISKNSYVLTLTKNGSPLPATDIVLAPFGKPEDILKTDKDGKVIFTVNEAGLYIISADWIDKTPGTFKGKDYESVRYRLDYSFYKD